MLIGSKNVLWDRKLQGNEDAVALKLPIPQSFHTGPLNITVHEEDEFRMAILGRVASFTRRPENQVSSTRTRRIGT
jgi:hypothetical protein